MPAPADRTTGADHRVGRHSAPRTPLHRRPAVIAASAAVVLLGLVAGGALALRQPSDGDLAGAAASGSSGGSASRVTAAAPATSSAGGAATTLAAPVTTSVTTPATASGASSSTAGATATPASAEALRELAANPRIILSGQARQVLGRTPVDLRLATLLVQLSAQQPLSVVELTTPSSSAGGDPVRTAVLDQLAGRPVGADPEAVAALQRQLAAQDPAYRAEAAEQQDGATTTLEITLPPVTG